MQGDLRQALQYAAKNPNSQFAAQLTTLAKSGQLDNEARRLGLDLSPIKNYGSQTLTPEPVMDNKPQPASLAPVAKGVAKGVASTIRGIGSLGQTFLDKTVNKIPGVDMGSDLYRKNTELGQAFSEKLQPQTTGEKIGYGAEKLAELFLPASRIANAEKAADLIYQGSRTGRILSKAAINAVPAAGIVAAQTGSVKEGIKGGLLAGGTRAGFAVIGEGARALKIPERLYSTIFKNSSKEMLGELRSGGLATLQQNNPQRFQELIDSGIIKVGKDGAPIINDTLAEQAIDRGLRGSIRNMADTVVEGALNSEEQVQKIASAYPGTISLKEPQFRNVLLKIAKEYEDVGFGEISDEARALASRIKSSGGNVEAETAIQVRRFLDRVRIASSFDKPVVNLSTSQGNLKTLADSLRTRVNDIPGMSDVMKDYSFYINALESLANEAKRRGNNQVLSLIDSLFLSGAYAGNNPIPGITMGTLRKLLMSAPGTTYLGQGLRNANISPTQAGLITSGSAGVQSLLTGQE